MHFYRFITDCPNIRTVRRLEVNEHLPTLYKYATECESAIECGVRNCVSSWALCYGLLNNNKVKKQLILNDVEVCNVDELMNATDDKDISIEKYWISNLELELNDTVDLTFIDTWHTYGQLKRELNKFGKITNKYIIMHDTTIDGEFSESVRNKHDINAKMEKYNFNYEDVTIGLWKAIEEFLLENKE